jgi:hypothetical protein
MRVLKLVGRVLAHLITTAAKTIGGMSGAKTFDHDNATSIHKRSDDHPSS